MTKLTKKESRGTLVLAQPTKDLMLFDVKKRTGFVIIYGDQGLYDAMLGLIQLDYSPDEEDD